MNIQEFFLDAGGIGAPILMLCAIYGIGNLAAELRSEAAKRQGNLPPQRGDQETDIVHDVERPSQREN